MIYLPEMSLGAARELYFELNNFGKDGGYNERWIKVKYFKMPVWLPNTAGRKQAVKLHDLHHVLTEYPTTWRGEAEISAWEVGAGGLARFYAGWWLDLMNVAHGLVINPRGVYHAFMRGRKSSNLYRNDLTDEMLRASVGEYRQRLKLNSVPEAPNTRDFLAFVFWSTASSILYILSIGLFFAAIAAAILLIWRYLSYVIY